MSDHYILEGRELKPVDLMTWAKWLETNRADKIVKQEPIKGREVSTVFLGLDHQFGDGPPLLFETMVFKKDTHDDIYCDRCSTYDEALQMHEKAIAWIIAGEPETTDE